ncbi:MAG: nuclear transport factor 2 family protein [Alphaproteobacteria bacterium]|nr:nuclear transport factor 2 family protein [Alphaproteobacteria bacterium]
MTRLVDALAAYARFYETLSPATLPGIAALLAPNARFKDPFNDVRGADRIVRLLATMYEHGTPRFEVIDQAVSERAGYLLWRYTSDPGGGRAPWVIDGMTELRFDADGRVLEHVDHWDAAGQFYEKLPVVGWLIRRIKRRLQLREG